MCSNKKLLMMDTMVSETCRAAQSEIKFYGFEINVHLVGFYSILSLMMHGNMNVKYKICESAFTRGVRERWPQPPVEQL
jgi:hypothetical protein